MEKLLCPSLMCADFSRLGEEIKLLDEAGADIFHCDIMDGNFVPTFQMGLQDVIAVRKNTDKLIDCHLVISDPADKIKWFADAGADIIYIHSEAETHTAKTLSSIRELGCKSGLAIDPDTSVDAVYEMLYLADYVMIMTVYPGFAGQKYIEPVTEKIKKIISLKEKFGFKVMIDGACSPEKIKMLSDIGADGFILGTSALFDKDKDYKTIMRRLRKL